MKNNTHTVEFNNSNDSSNSGYTDNINSVRVDKHEILQKDIISTSDKLSDKDLKRAAERKKRLQKFHNLNFNNQIVLKDLENQPAYKRQGVELDNIDSSSVEPVSRIVVDQEKSNVTIKNNNKFLHDNVD